MRSGMEHLNISPIDDGDDFTEESDTECIEDDERSTKKGKGKKKKKGQNQGRVQAQGRGNRKQKKNQK